MKEKIKISAQMIKVLNIKNAKEYNRLLKYYKLLSSESLKYMMGTRSLKTAIELLKEVA